MSNRESTTAEQSYVRAVTLFLDFKFLLKFVVSGVNLATSEHKAVVITGRKNITELLAGNRNIDLHADHDINSNEKNGITIKFDHAFVINHIHMMLWDGEVR